MFKIVEDELEVERTRKRTRTAAVYSRSFFAVLVGNVISAVCRDLQRVINNYVSIRVRFVSSLEVVIRRYGVNNEA